MLLDKWARRPDRHLWRGKGNDHLKLVLLPGTLERVAVVVETTGHPNDLHPLTLGLRWLRR